MAALIKAGYRNYEDIVVGKMDHRSDGLFLMTSIWQPIFVLLSYVYFVFFLGPMIMKNRPSYKLEWLMKLYNLSQVLLNCLLFTQGLKMGWGTRYKWICEPIDYSESPEALVAVRTSWLYLMLKIFDFMDTVFMVLRKKDKQISFLHVYHHSGIFFGAWLITKYFPGGHGTFVGVINVIVHAIMYSYYFITVLWPEFRYNWIKKSLTQLQMLQFFMVAVHAVIIFFMNESCKYPGIVSAILFMQNFVMMLLFYDFYRKTYTKKHV